MPTGMIDGRCPMDVMFREICAGDIDELFAVRAATRENAIPRERLAQMGVTPASIAAGLASGATKGWVCSCESRIAGLCMGEADSGEVLVLAMLPDYERRGIGKALLALAVEWLASFSPARIWLGAPRSPNVRAHGFYRALGWRSTGQLDAHGDEILVLTRRDPSSPPRG